jgi:predicted dehydrogenase
VFNVGLVGFGRLARAYYTPALRTFGSVRLVAVADPLPASRAAASKSFPDATIHSDYQDLCALPIDGLLVASPPSTHLAILNDALRRRLPVFVEKPFLLCGELGQLNPSSEARRLLMPNFNRRFWPAYARLREISATGRLGKVQRAEFTLRIDVRPWVSVTSHRVEEREGGALYDLGSSQFDLIQYLLRQKIVRIRAEARSARWRNDQIMINAQLESGVAVSCELSHAERNRERIVIIGDIASARIDDPNCAVHVETHHSWKDRVVGLAQDAIALGPKALMRRRSMLRYTIRSSLAEFFGALAARRAFSPNFDDAVENIACLEAATVSISENKIIDVAATGISANV